MAGETKKQVCMLCGKPSEKSICANCADRVRGEALHKKKKQEKPEK
jgi:predicted amidophosphoribosyltransferase